MRKGKVTLKKYIEATIQKQDDWLRTAFLNELGGEFHGKTDEEIAEEAYKRGYFVTYDNINTTHELRNADGVIISTFKLKLEHKGSVYGWRLQTY